MKYFLTSVFYAFLFLFSSLEVAAHSSDESKIYINLNDLVINDESITLKVHDEFIPISNISKDDFGFFVDSQTILNIAEHPNVNVCGNGHIRNCIWCYKCTTPNCQYKCTCKK